MPSLAEKKRIVNGFLTHCNGYATERIAHYRDQLAGTGPVDALALQDKIGHWTAYHAFNVYAMAELETDALDKWFDDQGKQP